MLREKGWWKEVANWLLYNYIVQLPFIPDYQQSCGHSPGSLPREVKGPEALGMFRVVSAHRVRAKPALSAANR